MTKNNCDSIWSFGHQWGKWEVKEKSNITRKVDGVEGKIGFLIKQERTCMICGFVEMNVQQETI